MLNNIQEVQLECSLHRGEIYRVENMYNIYPYKFICH